MKKCFRIILTVVGLLALFTIGASAAGESCSVSHDSTNGIPLTQAQELKMEGQIYYLDKDITTSSLNLGENKGIYAFNVTANNVTLCLNGHNINLANMSKNASGVRVADNVTGFTLCNCQSGGGVVMGKAQRSLIVLGGASATMSGNVALKSSLKLDEATKSGTDIVQVNGATFTMDGGSISGNAFLGTGASTSKNVALVWNNSGTVNLNSGEICNNTVVGCEDGIAVAPIVVSSGTLNVGANFTLSNNTVQMAAGLSLPESASGILIRGENAVVNISGTISGNKGGNYGGVAMLATGTAAVDGGRITGNTAKKMSGGIYTAAGTLTVSNAEISGNVATDDPIYGAQVAISSDTKDTTTFTMKSGTINAEGQSANALVLLHGVAAISGGTINGTVGTVGVGGPVALTISGGTFNGRLDGKLPHSGAGVAEPCTISITGGKFSEDTDLGVLVGWLKGTMSQIEENGKRFWQVDADSVAVCDGSHSGFNVLNDYTLAIFANGNGKTISTSGKYYLAANITKNVTAADGTTCAINVTADNVTLCLGGHSVLPSNNHVAIHCSGKNLKIVNCSTSNGAVTGKAACSVQVVSGGNVIMGDNVHIDNATNLTTAPVVVEAGGSFTMVGGSISANKFTATQTYAGGAICAAGNVILYSGTISNNNLTAASGGFGSGAVTMTGGTLTVAGQALISNNTSTGHGGGVVLYNDASFNMAGGTISGNRGDSGGGVAVVAADARFNMSGGTISGNKAGRWGGGVAVRMGEFELSGGTIKDNDLTNAAFQYGNQITVGIWTAGAIGKFIMTGGEIIDTEVETTAGLMTSTDVTVTAGEATISGGSITGQVGTLGASTGTATLNISGGTIVGDVTNAVPLPTSQARPTEAQTEPTRRDTTIYITGGEFYGAIVETEHDNRRSATNTIISGGKFANFGDDARETLASFLDDAKEILSVMGISEGDLVYEVRPGLVYNGAYMDFGSSLDFGLNLVADMGDCTEVSGYTLSLSGADADVEPEILLKEIEGTKQLFVMAHGIAAKEMRDDITFTLKKDGEVWFTKTMSVYDAANEFRAEERQAAEENGTEANGDYLAMLGNMIYYGTQAQRRFGYNLRTLLSKPDFAETSGGEAWTEGDVVVSDGDATKVSLSLSLKEQIELNFYIRDPQARISNVTFAGEEIPASDYTVVHATGENDGYTMISFREIPITKAKETAQFTVTLRNATTFDVSGGVASYVKLAQNDSTEAALVTALRNYVESVYNVFSVVPEVPVAARVSVEEL